MLEWLEYCMLVGDDVFRVVASGRGWLRWSHAVSAGAPPYPGHSLDRWCCHCEPGILYRRDWHRKRSTRNSRCASDVLRTTRNAFLQLQDLPNQSINQSHSQCLRCIYYVDIAGWSRQAFTVFRKTVRNGETFFINYIPSDKTTNKTAELSQRRPRDAPNIWVPWKVSRVLITHPATFPEICNRLLFRSILRMCVQNLKFVALPVLR